MRIGVDLGGTKIEAAALDHDGRIVARKRVATPKDDYSAVLDAIAQLVAELEAEIETTATVGIGTPGAVSPATGLMKNANSVVLNGKPLDADLASRLGRAVRLANDADCFALSEATDGAARGAGNVFGAILGTGVGGGVVIRGALVSGPNAIAGEWGHNQLPYLDADDQPPPDCYCGRRGCIETFVSGPALERDYADVTGRQVPAKEIATRRRQDPEAGAALHRYAHRLARALSTVINILDPEVVVLGGGMSNIDWLYDRVPELWGVFVFSDTVTTRLVKNRHGDSSGVRGAAWLWPADG